MTQKEFVIGLIETEIERDLTQRAAVGEGQTESAAVNDCEDDSEKAEEEIKEQESGNFSGNFDDENDPLDESKVMTMGMKNVQVYPDDKGLFRVCL